MRTTHFFYPFLFATLSAASAVGCSADVSDPASADEAELRGPGKKATDARVPELGNDLNVLRQSAIGLGDALKHASNVIEAKFELGDDKKLSLSLYPLDKGFDVDAERQTFSELSGDPTKPPFSGTLEAFADQEHLTRSARDLTLIQLSRISLGEAIAQVIAQVAPKGFVFWAIPTIRQGRAGYGVYSANAHLMAKSAYGNVPRYTFLDGGGSRESRVSELGHGPGSHATDQRVPELGDDTSVVLQSKITMADALAASEAAHGPAIEAKFELGDDKKLSLSIYPVKNISLDAERNTFVEQAGDPTAIPFKSDISEFKVPDVEHLTRSARDLTLVQTAGLTLRSAVDKAQAAVPGGFVFWAIPTIRDTRSGYGVYVYGPRGGLHYLFIS